MNKKMLTILGVCIAVALAVSVARMHGAQRAIAGINTQKSDIGGVVTSSKGPEAGVWVIAETSDLPTKYVKIVVTDDQGRFLIPDLPNGNYKVWVRGYGLVDSQPVRTEPGKPLSLTATIAPDARAAAQYYPAEYWYTMIKIPPTTDFPGTGANGNGIPENIKTQEQWVDMVKVNNCESCHQLGDKATRQLPASMVHLHSVDAWRQRVASAQVGSQMINGLTRFGADRALKMYADWTDRIAAGQVPDQTPPRPQGVERNIVITEWDWGKPTDYFHDEMSTDRRNPT